jgi:hypothetical protein
MTYFVLDFNFRPTIFAFPYFWAMEVLYTNNFQPDIVLYGYRIGEPIITLTALIVSALCCWCYLPLRQQRPADDALRLSRLFFLLMSASTLIGALVGHALLYCLPFAFKVPGWALGMLAASALAQASVARVAGEGLYGWRRPLTYLNAAGFGLALWFVLATLWFPAVEIHTAFCLLLFVGGLEAWRWWRSRARSSFYLLCGIGFAVLAALVHALHWSISPWFCFFDIGHLLLCGTMWMIYKANAPSAQPTPFSP